MITKIDPKTRKDIMKLDRDEMNSLLFSNHLIVDYENNEVYLSNLLI